MRYITCFFKLFCPLVAVIFFLSGASPASPPHHSTSSVRAGSLSDLDEYVQLARKVDRYAMVTGSFWDWRAVSMYRSLAGYHYGYDIAMPRGTSVPAGWEGRVVAISPWADGEWGISILVKDGYTITYGHVVPRVAVGAVVNPGDIVGSIAVNHVDMKLRDRNGNFVDFGKTCGLLPVNPDAVVRDIGHYLAMNSSAPVLSRGALIQEMKHLKNTISVMEEYLRIEQDAYQEEKSKTESMEKLLEEELIARNTLEQEKEEMKKRKEHVESLTGRLKDQKARLACLKKQASLYGDLGKEKPEARPSKQPPTKLSELSMARVSEAKKKWDLYEKLFTEGAISKKELEDARKEYKKLQLEMMLERD